MHNLHQNVSGEKRILKKDREAQRKRRIKNIAKVHTLERKYREEHPDQIREKQRKYRKAHPEQTREAKRRWTAEHPESRSKYHRKSKFGMASEEYEQILEKQNGVCAICGGNRSKKALCVDHNHTTGQMRQLLCAQCNSALGLMADDPILLRKAADYLDQNK